MQVHFLHEDMIVESIQKAIEEKLLGCNASRTYFTQALLPGATVPVATSSLQLQAGVGGSGSVKSTASCEYWCNSSIHTKLTMTQHAVVTSIQILCQQLYTLLDLGTKMPVSTLAMIMLIPFFYPAENQPYAYQMVRTDAKEQKLDAFVVPKSLQHSDASSEVAMEMEGEKEIPVSSGVASGDRGGQPGSQDRSLENDSGSTLQQERLVYCF